MRRCVLFVAAVAMAQPFYDTSIRPQAYEREVAFNRGAAGLWQSLKHLHTRASLIMVTAHPDDEDGGTLAYESRGRGTRVALLSLNRGEGGANVMSPDFFDALGLVRTMELIEACRYYGAEPYWTRVVDYGFSKTRAESTSRWTHDRVLADVVRVIRRVRPLVVTSVFIGAPSDGHGNHETAGAMAREALQAAGDPARFPEQIRAGLRPWTPLKNYARVRGGAKLPVHVEIPQGSYDPTLGASYTQIAREGLGFQKSQNGGAMIPKAGAVASLYHRFASTLPAAEKEQAFFDGIDVSLVGIASLVRAGDSAFLKAGLARINESVEAATARFSAAAPERSAPALAEGLKATGALLEQVAASNLDEDAKYNIRHELEIKRAQFNNALAAALGLTVSASIAGASRMVLPGETIDLDVHAVAQGPAPVSLARITVEGQPGRAVPQGPLKQNQPVDVRLSVTAPPAYTRPYFTRPDVEQAYYDLSDERLLGDSLAPYPFATWVEFDYLGVPVLVGRIPQTAKRVTGLGTVYEPVAVGPPISVRVSPRAGVVPLNARAFQVTATVHSNVRGAAKGTLRLELPAFWKSDPASAEFATANEGEDRTLVFQVTPANLDEKQYTTTAVAEYAGREYREGYETTGYAGLNPYFLYRPATLKTSGADLKIPDGLKAAYVMGSGDSVPEAIEQLNVHVTSLSPADLASKDLSAFDVVLLGVRAYAVRPDVVTHNNRLLEYVRNGGVLIVEYNTPEFDRNFGPYPYEMGRDPEEVTDEESKVEILNPANPVFVWPNKITAKDFHGWVEERGSKWMKSWDGRYEPLLETHDQDQPPQKGGLLYAPYGKGVYIYNAYAFYRQLPAGVPGAYRLFANMLSLAKNPRRR